MRFLTFRVAVLLLAGLNLGGTARASADDSSPLYSSQCGQIAIQNSGEPRGVMKYCYTYNPRRKADHVVYFLHGLGGSEKSIRPMIESNEPALKAMGTLAPSFISVSFGPEWFLGKPGDLRTIRFLTNGIHRLEKRLKLHVKARSLYGKSMGGFNTLQVYFNAPFLFDRFVAQCPAILTVTPFDPLSEVQAFLARNPEVQLDAFQRVFAAFLRGVGDLKTWDVVNPLNRITRVTPKFPPLTMVYNSGDTLGFAEGSRTFQQLATEARAPLSVREVPGPHCHLTAQESIQVLWDLARPLP